MIYIWKNRLGGSKKGLKITILMLYRHHSKGIEIICGLNNAFNGDCTLTLMTDWHLSLFIPFQAYVFLAMLLNGQKPINLLYWKTDGVTISIMLHLTNWVIIKTFCHDTIAYVIITMTSIIGAIPRLQ